MRSVLAFVLAATSAACGAGPSAASGPAGKSSDCAPASEGGAAPPRVLSTDQIEALARLLKGYAPDRLKAADALAIRKGLCQAGIPDGPALHEALGQRGFSAKRLAELAPMPVPQADAANSAPVTPSGRRVPPRE